MSSEDVFQQAMQLSGDDREILAIRLLASLDDQQRLSVEEAWEEEIQSRIEEHKAGRTESLPSEEVFRKILNELGETSE